MPHAIKLNPLFSLEKERNKHMYIIALEKMDLLRHWLLVAKRTPKGLGQWTKLP